MTNDFGAPINDQGSELAKNKDEFPLLTNVGGDNFVVKTIDRYKYNSHHYRK